MSEQLRNLIISILEAKLVPKLLYHFARLDLVRGGEVFRSTIALLFDKKKLSRVLKYGECVPEIYFLTPYLIRYVENLIMHSVHVKSEVIEGNELIAPIPDELYEYYLTRKIKSMIYLRDPSTPENMLLKLLLIRCRKCIENIEVLKEFKVNIDSILKFSWLSQVEIPQGIDIDELVDEVYTRILMSKTRPEYNVLLRLGPLIEVREFGYEYIYRLIELYVLALIAESLSSNANVVINFEKTFGVDVLKICTDKATIYYQRTCDRNFCYIPDIIVRSKGKTIIVEVKASNYSNYIKKSFQQLFYYLVHCRNCGISDVKGLLTYYTLSDDVRKEVNNYFRRCVFSECKNIQCIDLEAKYSTDIAKLRSSLETLLE